jgi:hypothetical protein
MSQCPHYKGNLVCGATNRTITKTIRDNTCYSYSYDKCVDYKKASSGGCYITSAVCESFGKPDDCYELTMFRRFRDGWLKNQSGGNKAIQHYYANAPKIVDKINLLPNARTIWRKIYDSHIIRCIRQLESGDNQKCYELYQRMVDDLEDQYL